MRSGYNVHRTIERSWWDLSKTCCRSWSKTAWCSPSPEHSYLMLVWDGMLDGAGLKFLRPRAWRYGSYKPNKDFFDKLISGKKPKGLVLEPEVIYYPRQNIAGYRLWKSRLRTRPYATLCPPCDTVVAQLNSSVWANKTFGRLANLQLYTFCPPLCDTVVAQLVWANKTCGRLADYNCIGIGPSSIFCFFLLFFSFQTSCITFWCCCLQM